MDIREFEDRSEKQQKLEDDLAKEMKKMMADEVDEARAAFADNPGKLAQIEADYAQISKAQELQDASELAAASDDLEIARAFDTQKRAELDDLVARAGRRGGIVARLASWFVRRDLN